MQKSLFLVAFISSLILSMTACSTALDKKDPPSEQIPDKQLSYTFAEVRVEFPSSLWKLISEDEKGIVFVRGYKPGFKNAFAILVVDVYPRGFGFTREQHIKEYFNYERLKSRHQQEWSGFVEGTREVDGVHYPTMRYSVNNGMQSDGIFIILFPDDLEKRHRFYGLMLSEMYPEGKPAPGFPDLEFIVKNLEILPVLVSSDSIRVIEFYDPDVDTEAISSLDDQPPAGKGLMAIAHENAAMGKLFIISFSSDPGEVAGSEHGVYVFNNNPVPFCYTYKIPGDWIFMPELQGYQSKNGEAFVGVLASSAAMYDGLEGATIVQRVRNKLAKQYEARYGLQLSGVELEEFESDRHGTWKWKAASIRQDGRFIQFPHKYIVESSPKAIFQITVEGTPDNEELVRQIIKSLRTTSVPDCYFPMLESMLETMDGLR
jgi:hypothetical protein